MANNQLVWKLVVLRRVCSYATQRLSTINSMTCWRPNISNAWAVCTVDIYPVLSTYETATYYLCPLKPSAYSRGTVWAPLSNVRLLLRKPSSCSIVFSLRQQTAVTKCSVRGRRLVFRPSALHVQPFSVGRISYFENWWLHSSRFQLSFWPVNKHIHYNDQVVCSSVLRVQR